MSIKEKLMHKKYNKKGFSIFELVIVITLISILMVSGLSLFNVYKRLSFEHLNESIKLQIQGVRNLTWAGVTLKTSVSAKNTTNNTIGLNKNLSRFSSEPSYYTALLFTSDYKANSLLGLSSSVKNVNDGYYLLQYRQEKITDYANNIKEQLMLAPDVSSQLLKIGGNRFQSKFSYGSMAKIFFNKVVAHNGSCTIDPPLNGILNLYVVFDYDNLVPSFSVGDGKVITDISGNEITKVKLCFSTVPNLYRKESDIVSIYQEIILDKNTLYNTNHFDNIQ